MQEFSYCCNNQMATSGVWKSRQRNAWQLCHCDAMAMDVPSAKYPAFAMDIANRIISRRGHAFARASPARSAIRVVHRAQLATQCLRLPERLHCSQRHSWTREVGSGSRMRVKAKATDHVRVLDCNGFAGLKRLIVGIHRCWMWPRSPPWFSEARRRWWIRSAMWNCI